MSIKSLAQCIAKKLNDDFEGVEVDMYELAGKSPQSIKVVISFSLKFEKREDASNIINGVETFWDRLRNNIELEVTK